MKYKRKRRENPSEIEKKLDEDAMLCNTLWSARRRLIIIVLLNVDIDPNFPQNSFFGGFVQRKISFSVENIFSLATLSAVIYHIRLN